VRSSQPIGAIAGLLVLGSLAAAALAEQTPTEQRNLELYQRLIDAENTGDYDQMDRLFSPDLQSVVNGQPGEGQGPAVEAEVIRATREAFPDYVASVDRLIADGDHLAAGWRIAGTHTGRHPQIPLPPTNRPVSFSGCTILEIQDGQIIGALNYIDASAIMSQLGVTGVIGMVAYLVGGVIAVLLAAVALLTYRRIARSRSEGSARLGLGLALGAVATVAFLALSIGARDILNAAG
jgi:predicted ester cyclase